jgi:hypothetical protein
MRLLFVCMFRCGVFSSFDAKLLDQRFSATGVGDPNTDIDIMLIRAFHVNLKCVCVSCGCECMYIYAGQEATLVPMNILTKCTITIFM